MSYAISSWSCQNDSFPLPLTAGSENPDFLLSHFCRKYAGFLCKSSLKLDGADCDPTTAPTDMIGVPREPAWLHDESEIIKNPDFQTQLS